MNTSMSVSCDIMGGKVDVNSPEEEQSLSASDLESLAREAVMAAVDGRNEPRASLGGGDETILVGPGVKMAIMRGVMSATRELLSSQLLLSGPLKNAMNGLSGLTSDANGILTALKEIDSALATITSEPPVAVTAPPEAPKVEAPKVEAPVVVATPEVQKSEEPKPEEPKPEEPKPEEPKVELAATTLDVVLSDLKAEAEQKRTEPESTAKPEQTKPARAKPRTPRPPKTADFGELEDSGLVVNGIKIYYVKGVTVEPFKAFMREFCPEIMRGPVTPAWAIQRAQHHGWLVGKSTITDRIEHYIGTLTKKKDAAGNSIWTLPTNATDRPGSEVNP